MKFRRLMILGLLAGCAGTHEMATEKSLESAHIQKRPASNTLEAVRKISVEGEPAFCGSSVSRTQTEVGEIIISEDFLFWRDRFYWATTARRSPFQQCALEYGGEEP